MASPTPIRTRSERVATLQLEPSALKRILSRLLAGTSPLQLSLAALSAVLVIVALQAWRPPLSYREGQVPERDIVARIGFDVVDAQQTKSLKDQRRRETLCYYENRPQRISEFRGTLQNQMVALLSDKTPEQLTTDQRNILESWLQDVSVDGNQVTAEAALGHLRALLGNADQLARFSQVLQTLLIPVSESGVLKTLQHDSDQGSQRQIIVILSGSPRDETYRDVSSVLRGEIIANLPGKVSEIFQREFQSSADASVVARIVSNYLVQKLPETLTYRSDLSEVARTNAEDSVPDAVVSYYPGISKLATAGQPISRVDDLPLLRAEYESWLTQLGRGFVISRLAAFVGLIFALYVFCGLYIHYLHNSKLLTDPLPLVRLLGLVVLTCLGAHLASREPSRAELVPVLLSAIIMAFTFGRQIAAMVGFAIALVTTLALGLTLVEFVSICSACFAASMLVGRIRTRSKLIYVGLAIAGIVAIIHFSMDTVCGRLQDGLAAIPVVDTAAKPSENSTPLFASFYESLRLGGFCILAAALVAGALPFVEKIFGVQTDLSLLELGDASHPLLRKLAQRAPGTYNHSINVAAIAEAAADSIGAHGLLTRVGAYFHDIGKMFKPNYFVENQEAGGNCHDALQPAMSTLVIIAHVKDGADLARQHHLPKRIVDFIEQHHGTTLVEYFYNEANKRNKEEANREEVSETAFRYPGPKPQTVEAAVLMLADSVESASRTLVEPTPARLQNLVDKLAMKKLLDGQFDECGLTLKQLDAVKASLVKSLTSIYHSRIKYAGQATA